MIGYVTLGTNDLQRGAAFYDALFAEMGAKRLWDLGTMIAWGVAMDKPAVVLTQPFDGQSASVGNGILAPAARRPSWARGWYPPCCSG